jgi:tRNA modification GTPase
MPIRPTLPAGRLRYAVNKIDLPPAWDVSQVPNALRVSAKTGAGIGDLVAALARWLAPDPPPPGAAVPFTTGQCDRIEQARELLSAGQLPQVRQLLAKPA